MNTEQRADANETDAQRRYRGWALANERGETIAELVSALKRLTAWIDVENSNHEGMFRELFPSCNECTQGNTPHDLDKGPCPYHQAHAAIKRGEKA